MAKANSKLASLMSSKAPNPKVVEAKAIPAPDTTNKSGHAAYSQDKWLKLLTMLNTVKLQAQYYRSEKQTLIELSALIKECALENIYLTCQCIVYSRCLGEGMRSISHAASIFVAPYVSGHEFSKRFYGPWNKKESQGGVIFRADDMNEIMSGFIALNGEHKITTTTVTSSSGTTSTSKVDVSGTKLTNAMKKGFKAAIESYDSYTLLKYKSSLIDVINLVRPNPANSRALVKVGEEQVYTLDAIMKGMSVSADTWEANQSEAGQIVAKAVKEGKIDEKEAKTILTQAKADNWEELLDNNKLGILAAIRNLRNVVTNNPKSTTIDKLCNLLSNGTKIKEGKIMPYQLDMANEILMSEFNNSDSRKLSQALATGYQAAVPNLQLMLPGRNLIMLDMSGSMSMQGCILPNGKRGIQTAQKAALIAATIAKATNADVIVFGSSAKYLQYNPSLDVFSLAKQLCNPNMGGTSLASAWRLAQTTGRHYDRVFILSDNECNIGSSYASYMSYVKSIGSPYVYSVDLSGYGTNCIAGDKVRYYYGYGLAMFDDIASSEFNAYDHLEKVRKVII